MSCNSVGRHQVRLARKKHIIAAASVRRALAAVIALSLVFVVAGSGLASLSLAADLGAIDKAASTPTAPGPAPDLVIQSITWSPPAPSVGDMVTFSFAIKNQGNDTAGPSSIAYYIDDVSLGSDSVATLAAGITATKTLTWTARMGSHMVKGVVDSGSQVVEGDETNNEKSYAFSPVVCDLIIESITWSPLNPSRGDKVTFNVNIKNQGNGKAGASRVDFYIDGASRGYQDVEQIDAGRTSTKTFTWVAQAGAHDIKAVADSIAAVVESDETNNERTVTFSTMAPDLIVQSITWLPQSVSKGDLVTFTIIIKNQGSGRADVTQIACYVDGKYLTSVPAEAIETGATLTKTCTWTAEAGPHDIKVVADSNAWVVEGDETNNERTVTFSTLAPDLIIQSITWSPQNPSKGDAVTLSIIIKNQGGGRSDVCQLACYGPDSTLFQDVATIAAGALVTKTVVITAGAGSHVVKALADSSNQVVESDENNNVRTVTLSTLAPDLIVQNITWLPENPVKGEDVTFTVTVKNQGTGRAEDSHVAYYVGEVCISLDAVGALSAGVSANRTFTWKAGVGSYAIKAVADYNKLVVESNETNNENTATFVPSAPDLIISAVTWAPENPSKGDKVTLTVVIKNQGSGQADYSTVSYYVDDSFRGYHDVQAMAPLTTVTKAFTWTAEADSHVIKVTVDSNNQVTETNEANNSKALTLPPPDLAVQSITCSPASASVGDLLTFTVIIANQGTNRVDSSLVTYYVDDVSLSSQSTSPMAAGGTLTQTFTWTAMAGSHVVKAVIDPADEIIENDESNNVKTITVSTIVPDLIIEAITWRPSNPIKGEEVIFSVIIKNRGTGRADVSRVTYQIDGSSSGYNDVERIDAGATALETFKWQAKAGSHIIRVAADSNKQIVESDETNNEAEVRIPPPDLMVQSITWSPASPADGDNVTLTVTVKNQGSEKSDPSQIVCYINDAGLPPGTLGAIAPGGTVAKSFTWTARAGSINVKILVDPANQVVESDENNNTRSEALSVLPVKGKVAQNPAGKAVPVSPTKGTLQDMWWWIFIGGMLVSVGTAVAILKLS